MTSPTSNAVQRRPLWHLGVGLLTDVGRMRERNEDAYAAYVPYPGDDLRTQVDALFLVADGMGGHEAGNVASRHAADRIREWFTRPASPDGDFDPREEFQTVFRHVHRELIDLARENGLGRGVGTTATVAAITGTTLHVGHVGDSRLYRWRDGALEQVTEDHSWIAEQTRAGLVSAEEAATHPNRNVLTQCLGIGKKLKIFVASVEMREGDRYLLSSDGLHGAIDADGIAAILGPVRDPQEAVRRLVQAANEMDGSDNITAVVFDVRPAREGAPTEPGAATLPLDMTGPIPGGSHEAENDDGATSGPAVRARRIRAPHAMVGLGTLVLLAALITAVVGRDELGEGPQSDGIEAEPELNGGEPADSASSDGDGSGPDPPPEPAGPDADAA